MARHVATSVTELSDDGPWLPLLDRTYDGLNRGASGALNGAGISGPMASLFDGLSRLRTDLPAAQWAAFCRHACLDHPLRRLLHEDPFTYYAFVDPRDGLDDVSVVDLAHGVTDGLASRFGDVRSSQSPTTQLGRKIYAFTRSTPPAAALRGRGDYVVNLIDACAEAADRPSVLAVACGNLREASRASSVIERRVRRFVALDPDPSNLEVVRTLHASSPVQPWRVGAVDFLSGRVDRHTLGTFDLIYTAGLYDALADETARALTASLWPLLNAGGCLCLGNLRPGVVGTGYLESFMGRTIVYRTPDALASLADVLPAVEVEAAHVTFETSGNVAFLEVYRR